MSVDRPAIRIPGPVDRETFFDAQRRHRAAARWFGATAFLFAAIIGAGVAAAFTPTIYLIAALVIRAANVFVPLTDAMRELRTLLQSNVTVLARWMDGRPVTTGTIAGAIATLILPSVVAVVAVWVLVRAGVARSGAGAAALVTGARAPAPATLTELELTDVVDEMSLAAGLKTPPRVLIVDAPQANAGIVGASPENACLIVSQGLLAGLTREQLQGIVGHLVGSAGNGDLGLAVRMTAIFQTIALVQAIMDAPFHRRSRAAVVQWFRLLISRSDDAPRREAGLSRVLALTLDGADEGPESSWKALASAPVTVLRIAVQLYAGFLCGPFITLLWRSRRYLADATAVELTRDPDGLSGALERLAALDTAVPGGESWVHVFVVGGEYRKGTGSLEDNLSFGELHPAIDKRLARLKRMGADAVGANARAGERPARPSHRGAAFVVFSIFGLILGPLFAALFVMMFVVVLVFNYIAALVYLGIVLLLLR